MGINWERIYRLNNENNKHAGTAFEKLVLDYLKSTWPQFAWEGTQSSWDDNRDFVSLVLDNIWAEAKYKKDSTALRKQDIDPTVVSGTLEGGIRVIFFITNGYVPETILKRISKACNTYALNIICISKTQLEYWLILHPAYYEYHFKEKLLLNDQKYAVALIKNIDFINQIEPDSNLSGSQIELLEKQYYVLNITFESNEIVEIDLPYVTTYPFNFIESPDFADPKSIILHPGIQHVQFLVYITTPFRALLPLKYTINGKIPLEHGVNLVIYPNKNLNIHYIEQFLYAKKLFNLLEIRNSGQGFHLTISGEKGVGKTYLLKMCQTHFYQKLPVARFEFYQEGDIRNALLFCRLIIFVNFGNMIRYLDRDDISDSIDYYKHILSSTFDPMKADPKLLLNIFEGCYDSVVATHILEQLYQNPELVYRIIISKRAPSIQIALLDEIQNLGTEQIEVLRSLIKFSETTNCTAFLIADESNNFLPDKKLNGLSREDIVNNLKDYLPTWSPELINSVADDFSNKPGALCDNILFFRQNMPDVMETQQIENYIFISDNNFSIDFFAGLEQKYIDILGLVYEYENGVDLYGLKQLGITTAAINDLCKKGYIKMQGTNIIAGIPFYRTTYIEKYKSKYNEKLVMWLKAIIMDPIQYGSYFSQSDTYRLLYKHDSAYMKAAFESILSKLQYYLYFGDYINLLAHSEAAFYSIRQKEPTLLCETDFKIAFHYGISLLHCDRKGGAIEVFRWIKNNAAKDDDVFYMAICEFFNNLYNRFEVDGIDSDLILAEMVLKRKIANIKDEDLQNSLDLRIAYSTCMNRAMMISFLQDDVENATTIFENYCDYDKKMSPCRFSPKYESMLGEWKLDYARGIMLEKPTEATTFFKESINLIGSIQNPKRHLLARINSLLLECESFGGYIQNSEELHKLILSLKYQKLDNEYLRGYIAEQCCHLVYLFTNYRFRESKNLKSVFSEKKLDAFKIQLDSKVYTVGRLAYQIRMYLAALEIFLGNHSVAIEYLKQNYDLVKSVGASYSEITFHNMQNVSTIKTIVWGFNWKFAKPDEYLLDPRIW